MPSTTGFMLGVIGGILDFASATSLLLTPPAQSMIGTGQGYAEVAVGLYLLGVLVIVSTLLSAMMAGMERPRVFSVLMTVYGIIMAAVGWIMLSVTASEVASSIYSYGMVVVGALMVANGILVLRSRVEM